MLQSLIYSKHLKQVHQSVAVLLLLGSAFVAVADEALIRTQADLQNYLDNFNNHRYAEQIAYYAPDVAYAVGDLQLTSPQAIADFYSDFHQYVREHVEIAAFAKTGDTVAVVMPTVFEAFRDYDKHGLAFPAGSRREIVSFIFYELKDGKIHRIRVARYNGSADEFQH
ncbi:MAG: nuclear transport factor 2 family protein [Gammaproteobacteria bacterium]|nr:nuclear transport factor 2 family protein [Gammaproteobacteria bacterium]